MGRRRASDLKGSRNAWALRALVAAVLFCPLTSPAAPPTLYKLAHLKALEKAFVELADTVRPSVVAIRCYQVRDPADRHSRQARLPISQGSGFIIDAAGFIATNEHVIEDAHVISITLHNGLQYEARVVQTDVRSDLAVLKIDAEGLRPVRLGDSADLKVNQWSFACGNPFGLGQQERAAAKQDVPQQHQHHQQPQHEDGPQDVKTDFQGVFHEESLSAAISPAKPARNEAPGIPWWMWRLHPNSDS